MLKKEISQIKNGKIINTKLRKIFAKYCNKINSLIQCENLMKYARQMVTLKGHDFTARHSFQIQVIFEIPKIQEYTAKVRNLKTFPIPSKEKNVYLLPKVEDSIIEMNHNNFSAENCINNLNIFICENNYQGTNYYKPEISYKNIYSLENCIIKVIYDTIIISSKINGLIQKLEQPIKIIKFGVGISVLPRSNTTNIIITCGSLSRTIYFREYINTEVSVKYNTSDILKAVTIINTVPIVEKTPLEYKFPNWLIAISSTLCILNTIASIYLFLKNKRKTEYIIIQKPCTEMGTNTTE